MRRPRVLAASLAVAAFASAGVTSQAAATPSVTVPTISCPSPGQLRVTYAFSGFAAGSFSAAQQIYVNGVQKYGETTPLVGPSTTRTVTILGIYFNVSVSAKAQATQNGVTTNGSRSASLYCGKP